MSIIITLIGLSVVIFLHELGHMLAAKRAGIGVSEFSLGMGPKLFSYKWGETEYTIRLLLLGGFVRLVGLDDESEQDAPNAYPNKSIIQRFWTIFWGPLMNLILGFLIFLVIFSYNGIPDTGNLRVDGLTPNFPAEIAGVYKNDILLNIDGLKLESIRQLSQYLNQIQDQSTTLTVIRDGNEKIITMIPKKHQGKFVLGVSFSPVLKKGTVFEVCTHSIAMTKSYIFSVFIGIKMLVTGQASIKEMTGPIGIIQFASFNLNKGMMYFLNVMAMISISLGVINLFPFPVLDGGHIIMLGIEAIRGKKLNKKWFNLVNNIGAASLITLMILIIINDIRFWQDRVSLFKSIFGP